jgi:hypothetical protein
MKIDWTKVGKDYNATQEQKDLLLKITNAIDAATTPAPGNFNCWCPVKDANGPLKLGMMQGMGLSAFIKEFKIPGVTHVAVSALDGPGLYGVRAHYEKGKQRVDIWVVDDGVEVTPVMAKVHDETPQLAAA